MEECKNTNNIVKLDGCDQTFNVTGAKTLEELLDKLPKQLHIFARLDAFKVFVNDKLVFTPKKCDRDEEGKGDHDHCHHCEEEGKAGHEDHESSTQSEEDYDGELDKIEIPCTREVNTVELRLIDALEGGYRRRRYRRRRYSRRR
jgi:hypothetical protein